MLRDGFLGEPNGAPPRDPEAMALLFDTHRAAPSTTRTRARRPVRRSSGSSPDAEPWHVRRRQRLDRGGAGPRAEHVDLELRCRYDDWVDVVAGRLDPRRAVATGRLRPRGNPRALWRARGLFSA